MDLEVQGGGGGKGTYWAHLPTRSEAKFIYSVAVLPALPFLCLETAPRNSCHFPIRSPKGCHVLTSPVRLLTVNWPRHRVMT